jgi:hypothetical protein
MNLLESPSFKKVLSSITFALIVILLVNLINFEYKVLGIPHPFFPISEQTQMIIDIIYWMVIACLSLELLVAYLKIRNTREFLKKYWLEIIMLVLMPIFSGFKLLKITTKLLKKTKIAKTTFKAIQKLKKIN